MNREATLDAAIALVDDTMERIWAVEAADARLALALATERPVLGARDLIHLACCRRRDVPEVMTFDRALAAAWGS